MNENEFDFERALAELKKGRRLQRSGWNGKGMYVLLMTNAISVGHSREMPYGAQLDPFFVIVSPGQRDGRSGAANTWVPSVSDILADDWMVLA